MDTNTDVINPSLCIPRIFENVSHRYIRGIFEKINLGPINRIDIIERKTEKGENYKRAYIHFHKWNTNDDTLTIQQRLISGKDIKIVHNNPWYWKVFINKWHK
jgi:hypothetical protein